MNTRFIGGNVDNIINVTLASDLVLICSTDTLNRHKFQAQFHIQGDQSQYPIILHFNTTHFPEDEMTSTWYNGNYSIEVLEIWTNKPLLIHSNAFSGRAFLHLKVFILKIQKTSLRIHDGSFSGLKELSSIQLLSPAITGVTVGLFDAMASTLLTLSLHSWPNNLNLDEMFTNETYRILRHLQIINVKPPPTKFRKLAASNFTFTRRLQKLWLMYCGIEVIAQNAFDGIAHTLIYLNLQWNLIKTLDLRMFRKIYESKSLVTVHLPQNGLMCDCKMVEIEILSCPIQRKRNKKCVECVPPSACGDKRVDDVVKLCIRSGRAKYMRYVGINMALTFEKQSLLIRSNFASTFRMLFINFDAMGSGDCSTRSARKNYKCLSANKYLDQLDLNEIAEIRDAELVSITAIPILYNFGARPMHSLTVRREVKAEDWTAGKCALIHVTTTVLGIAVGLCTAICAMRRKKPLICRRATGHGTMKNTLPQELEQYEEIGMSTIMPTMGDDVLYDIYNHETEHAACANDYI